MNGTAIDGRQFDTSAAKDGNPLGFVETIKHNGKEEFHEVDAAVSFLDNDFKVGIVQAYGLCDFKITTVVADAGDEGKAGDTLDSVYCNAEARHFPAQLAEAAVPIRELAEFLFEVEI